MLRVLTAKRDTNTADDATRSFLAMIRPEGNIDGLMRANAPSAARARPSLSGWRDALCASQTSSRAREVSPRPARFFGDQRKYFSTFLFPSLSLNLMRHD